MEKRPLFDINFKKKPFPTVEQLMFPNNQEDIVYLDVEENSDEPTGLKFEDQDWDQYLP